MVISKTSTLENAVFFLPSISHKQQPQSIQFFERTQEYLSYALAQTVTIFCCHQQKIQKISHFGYFNDSNLGSKHDNETNDPIFLISHLSCICCYIYFMHFKTLEIQFHGVPHLHYVLVCEILISC